MPGAAHPSTIALAWHHPTKPGVALPRGGARFLSSTRLAFVTVGSGSCPALPSTLAVVGRSAIRLELAPYDPGQRPCTADLTTTSVEVAIDPRRVDVHHDLTIQLVYEPGGDRVALSAPAL
ncbi:MAG TPA: hypothetical protein VK488_13000 [Gaiellaceae bacterium]|nr:hypothetical protein [Gaiellaceae bacterium]